MIGGCITNIAELTVVVVVARASWGGRDGLRGGASGDRAVGARAGVDGGVDVGVDESVSALVAVGGGVAVETYQYPVHCHSLGLFLQRLWVGGHDLGGDDVGGEDEGWANNGRGDHV